MDRRYLSIVLVITALTWLSVVNAHFHDDDNDVDDERVSDKLAEKNLINGRADVVFLLDRSGSVGATNFEIMKGFVESLLTHVVVEANATRIAVISYSDTPETHLNYIRDPKTKCHLSEELQNIVYKDSGATNIAAALDEARNILLESRPNVNKVVIIISDGLATLGGNPIPAGEKLKTQTGAEVFAFGIGMFLKKELQAIATSPDHVYSCKGFRQFKRLARKIRGDPHETNWSGQASTPNCDHLCNSPYKGEKNDPGCCDHYGRCSCALLSGMHNCVCAPGYFGLKGTWGDCMACPRGTYKSSLEPSRSCTKCPPGSTTAETSSTSIKDCYCKEGYVGDILNGRPCEPIKCPPLQNPTNGFILHGCKNHYDAKCIFMCKEGYELDDKRHTVLRCLSDGSWSSSSPLCQKTICQPLDQPRYGKIICDGGELVPGKMCHTKCYDGFMLHGSKQRTCTRLKLWTGEPAECKPISCPIPDSLSHGTIVGCSSIRNPSYGDSCALRCNYGYQLVGPEFFTCDASGNLVDPYSGHAYTVIRPYCEDVLPPDITCPRNIIKETVKGQNFAYVDWKQNPPEADDNSGEQPVIESIPPGYKFSGKFPIGTTYITYRAKDKAGLSSACEFFVEVVDREPPQVVSCPGTIEVNTTEEAIAVYWKVPVFKDNSQNYYIRKKNFEPGDVFLPGSYNAFYLAVDPSDNQQICEFRIIVSQHYCPYHAPPINGALTCEDWMYGQFCQVYCNARYDFVQKPAEWYVCNENAKWETLPNGYPVPWPDCTRKVFPSHVRKMMSAYYYHGDCRDPRVQDEIRAIFLTLFRKRFRDDYCVSEGACTLDMVKVSCGEVEQDRRPRFKRDLRNLWHELKKEMLEIEFDITIHPDQQLELSEDTLLEFLNAIENLDWDASAEINDLVSDNSSLSQQQGSVLKVTSNEMIIVCELGSELRDKECMLCPPGTFHKLSIDKCSPCEVGYYQDTEGQTECQKCPPGTSTKQIHSTNATDCKAFCKEGTYSTTGLETCIACPIGTYQSEQRQTVCNPCPDSFVTATEASTDFSDCRESCSPGYYSDTGVEPCTPCPRGYYQEHYSQNKCEECPGNLTTISPGSSSEKACIDFDPCANGKFCQNNGTCAVIGKEPVCSCPSGYDGLFCEVDVDECHSNPCLNGGKCMNTNGSFYCECNGEHRGHLCETEVGPCDSEPCLNQATACVVMDDGGYQCMCSEGFRGKNCEESFEQCNEDLVCENGGVCVEPGINGSCSCLLGYAGLDCSVNVDDCYNVTCSNGGSCVDGIDSFRCACPKGFTGQFCEEDINDCINHECFNGSTCRDLVDGYQCLCPPGWRGDRCENQLSSDFVLSFPENSTLANMATVRMESPLSQVTVSMWVQTNDIQSYDRSATPMSYASVSVEDDQNSVTLDNALTISDCSDVVVYINNEPLVTDVQIADGEWHHFSFAWSSESGEWTAYKDGKLKSNGTGFQKNQKIPKGGMLVLGQEQDEVGGGFNPLQTFTGNITRLNIWNSFFSSDDVERLCQMQDSEPSDGRVVAWPDVLDGLKGDVRVLDNETPIPSM